MNRNKTTFTKKRGRPPKTTCRALVPLNTQKIRDAYLKRYNRRKKALEKLEAELRKHNEHDEPEFQRFLASTFGAELTRQREIAMQIHLIQSRYEKVSFLSRENGMSKERFCHSLKEKITSEFDFWMVLEAELTAFLDEQEKMREEMKRDREKIDANFREALSDDDEFGDFYDYVFDDDECDAEFNDIFGDMTDNIFGSKKDDTSDASDAHTLKKLYRELCLRYHPDKAGSHDEKTKRIWNALQDAYQNGDLDRLRSIIAGIELESGNSELRCSEIENLIYDIECSMQMNRRLLQEQKRTPFWGFSAWTEKKRKQASKEIKFEFDRDYQMASRHLSQLEKELERLLHSYKPKPQKKTRQELHREIFADVSDLFDDVF